MEIQLHYTTDNSLQRKKIHIILDNEKNTYKSYVSKRQSTYSFIRSPHKFNKFHEQFIAQKYDIKVLFEIEAIKDRSIIQALGWYSKLQKLSNVSGTVVLSSYI